MNPFFEQNQKHIIPALIGAAGMIGAGIYSAYKSSQNQKSSNDSNEKISEANLKFQRENLEYQKAVQQKQWQREDTAYQRTVNDMRSAGMSPLAMNGTDNAGEVVSTTAPQYTHHVQADTTTPQILANSLNNAFSIVSQVSQAKLMEEQARGMKLDNDIKEEYGSSSSKISNDILSQQLEALRSSNNESSATWETRKAQLEKQLQSLSNDVEFQNATYEDRIKMVKAQLSAQGLSNSVTSTQLANLTDSLTYNRTYGVTDNMSETEKMIRMFAPALGIDLGNAQTGFKKFTPEETKKMMTALMTGGVDSLKDVLRSLVGSKPSSIPSAPKPENTTVQDALNKKADKLNEQARNASSPTERARLKKEASKARNEAKSANTSHKYVETKSKAADYGRKVPRG